MPRDKRETLERILPAARQEFLKKGFEGASMRAIAARAGLTAAGLYRHFTDKEELFEALVKPALQAWEEFYGEHREASYRCLEEKDMEKLWQENGISAGCLDMIYRHFDSFRLLLIRSRGSGSESFLHGLIMREQQETLAFLEAARERGLTQAQVDEKELHLLLTAWSNAMFEFVIHDFSREEAEHYIGTLNRFFTPGWQELLGLKAEREPQRKKGRNDDTEAGRDTGNNADSAVH